MGLPNTPGVEHVRIIRCPHGANYVTLGRITLVMTDAELALLDRAIHRLADRTPDLRRELRPAGDR